MITEPVDVIRLHFLHIELLALPKYIPNDEFDTDTTRVVTFFVDADADDFDFFFFRDFDFCMFDCFDVDFDFGFNFFDFDFFDFFEFNFFDFDFFDFDFFDPFFDPFFDFDFFLLVDFFESLLFFDFFFFCLFGLDDDEVDDEHDELIVCDDFVKGSMSIHRMYELKKGGMASMAVWQVWQYDKV